MPQFETVESILTLRDTSRHLYECINAHVVIVSPCDLASRMRSHWVFDESFDNLERWNVPLNYWQEKNVEERYGALPDADMPAIWEWFHARKLSVAQVSFGYPELPF